MSLWGSSGGSLRAVVALWGSRMVTHYWEQWWLIGGSSGGSLVATPDCKPAVPGSNSGIFPAYSGLPILGWAAIWDGIPL